MIRRFIDSAKSRRYTVKPDWRISSNQPCLLNIGHRSQEKILDSRRQVVFRVAGMFLRDYFDRMRAVYKDRVFKPEFEKANEKIRHALKTASFVIYQSAWSKKNLDSLYQRPDGTWKIIPNAVDLKLFSPRTEWPRRPKEIPVLGAVGSLRYRSRMEVLFDVAERLPVRPHLLLIGDMDKYCHDILLKSLAKPLWKNNITHIKSVPPELLPQYYHMMDCMVHTVAGDSCPNVVVEALACGVPVVCPEDGGTKELVDDAGFSVVDPDGICGESMRDDMAKAIMQILERLPDYQKRARQRAENNNNLEILTSQYLKALGFPPYAYERGYKYKVARAIGNLVGFVTPKITIVNNEKPRIALILWDWNIGGIASWMFRLVKALPEYEFHFIATHLEQHAPECDELGRFAYLPSFWSLRNYLRQKRISLLQVHNNRWPIDAAKAAGIINIIERTDGARSCCSLSKNELHYVIVSAAGTLPYVRAFWPHVTAKVIYNSIDLSEVDNIEAKRIAPSNCISIGRCSRFGKGKRLDLIIDAIAMLKQNGLPVHLTLAGEDSRLKGAIPVEKELRERALDLGETVHFYGKTSDPIALAKGFDIAVCTSDPFNEGIPNSLIEPMACGKPVIATDVDQVSELVEDGVNGILVPPSNVRAIAEALEILVRDPERRKAMGRAAREKIEKRFSFAVALKKYKEVYKSILQNE
ncbi:MAG: glycosyltransferase [Nitrospirota bacterium]